MKILILSQYWNPENGVPQRRWTWLTEELKHQGHEVLVLCPPPHYQRKVDLKTWFEQMLSNHPPRLEIGISGEIVQRTPFLPASSSLTSRALNQAVVAVGALAHAIVPNSPATKFQPDVVIGTVPALPTAFITCLVARRFRCPFIIDLRDAWPELLEYSDVWNSGTGRRSLRERVLSLGALQIVSRVTKIALDYSLQHASGLIVTADRLGQRLIDRLNKPAERVITIRNVFPVETPLNLRHHELDPGALNVLYAGTIGRAQDLENAVRAAKCAQDRGAKISLRFVGAGATKEAVATLARELGVSLSVEARRSADGLREVYEWADTALVQLADWEPLAMAIPSKVYELMDMGIHISAVAQGETADVIQSLRAGFVVPPHSPEALADRWVKLAEAGENLVPAPRAQAWVQESRSETALRALTGLLSAVVRKP